MTVLHTFEMVKCPIHYNIGNMAPLPGKHLKLAPQRTVDYGIAFLGQPHADGVFKRINRTRETKFLEGGSTARRYTCTLAVYNRF